MTKEEAIAILNHKVSPCLHGTEWGEALEMAIKALEQSPCGDAVSREVFEQVVRERNIAIEQLNELGYEFGEKIESCEGAISRQAVLDLVVANHTELNGLNVVMYSPLCKDIKQLPPVNPQESKTGRWIAHSDGIWIKHYECSECGKVHDTYSDYCPNCGAKMSDI